MARLREYRGTQVFVAGRQDWERFWETLLRFKAHQNILNTATAIAAMTEIAATWLDAQESEQEDAAAA
jgi:hypothetical protein